MRLLPSFFASWALLTVCSSAIADQIVFEDDPNQIILETATRDYLVRYVGNDGALKTIRWTPPTNINASVHSRFIPTEGGSIRYTYASENKKSSPQPIVSAKILVTEANEKSVTAPDSWKIFVVENPKEGAAGFWIVWSQYRTGLPPGQRQTGYAVVKPDLPGMATVWLSGASSMFAFSDEGPHGKIAEYLEGDFFFTHIDVCAPFSRCPPHSRPHPPSMGP